MSNTRKIAKFFVNKASTLFLSNEIKPLMVTFKLKEVMQCCETKKYCPYDLSH